MKHRIFLLAGLGLGLTSAALVQPAYAQTAAIVGIQLSTSESGFAIALEIPGGESPQVFTASAGETFIADLIGTQLRLAEGDRFFQENPAPGIASVEVVQQYANTVRVKIVGIEGAPSAEVVPGPQGVALEVTSATAAAEEPAPTPTPPVVEEAPSVPPAEEGEQIEIVVTATRTEETPTDVPRATTVIPRDEIEDQSLLTDDLSGILGRLVPGFGPPNPENRTRTQSLRGRPALILIDGIPQNSNTTFNTELSSIDPAAIERIEVVRGSSAVFGDGATGGIVNIITRPPVEEGFEQTTAIELQSDLNNFDDARLGFDGQYGVSASLGRFDFRLNGAFDTEPTHFDAEGDRIPPDGLSTDTETLNLLANLGFEISQTQRLQLTYNIFNNNFESDFIAVPGENGDQPAEALEVGEIDFDDTPEQTVQNLGLSYRNEAIFGSQLDAQFYYRETDLTQLPVDLRGSFPPGAFPAAPQVFQTTLDASELGTRLQVDSPLSEAVSLLWGVDYAREENEARFNAIDPAAFDAGEAEIVDRPTQAPFYTLESVGLFAQLQWDITDRLLFQGGARFESIDVDVDDYTASPFSNPAGLPAEVEGGSIEDEDVVFNAGLVFNATPNISLFTNFSQGFSIPQLGITLGLANFGTSVEDAVELDAQQVDNYELGIRGNWRDLAVSLVGFFNESELGSSLTVIDGITQPIRAPQRNYGLELSVDWTLSDRWRVGGILTWNEGEFDPEDEGDYVALSSIDVQPLNATLYLENETLPGWRNRIQAFFVADRDRAFDDGVDQFEVEGYSIFDFISSLELGPGNLELAIGNLFDEDYLPVSSQERFGMQANRRFAGRGRYVVVRYRVEF